MSIALRGTFFSFQFILLCSFAYKVQLRCVDLCAQMILLHTKCNCNQKEENSYIQSAQRHSIHSISFYYANLPKYVFLFTIMFIACSATHTYLFIHLLICNAFSGRLQSRIKKLIWWNTWETGVCCRFITNTFAARFEQIFLPPHFYDTVVKNQPFLPFSHIKEARTHIAMQIKAETV